MIIDVQCSCCGNHIKLSNEKIQYTVDLIKSGWGSCGGAHCIVRNALKLGKSEMGTEKWQTKETLLL